MSSDASVGKEKSKKLINEYFPVESIPVSHFIFVCYYIYIYIVTSDIRVSANIYEYIR